METGRETIGIGEAASSLSQSGKLEEGVHVSQTESIFASLQILIGRIENHELDVLRLSVKRVTN